MKKHIAVALVVAAVVVVAGGRRHLSRVSAPFELSREEKRSLQDAPKGGEGPDHSDFDIADAYRCIQSIYPLGSRRTNSPAFNRQRDSEGYSDGYSTGWDLDWESRLVPIRTNSGKEVYVWLGDRYRSGVYAVSEDEFFWSDLKTTGSPSLNGITVKGLEALPNDIPIALQLRGETEPTGVFVQKVSRTNSAVFEGNAWTAPSALGQRATVDLSRGHEVKPEVLRGSKIYLMRHVLRLAWGVTSGYRNSRARNPDEARMKLQACQPALASIRVPVTVNGAAGEKSAYAWALDHFNEAQPSVRAQPNASP